VKAYRLGFCPPDSAEQAPKMHLPNNGARTPIKINGDLGRKAEQALRQG
jgi:hypothetical protein